MYINVIRVSDNNELNSAKILFSHFFEYRCHIFVIKNAIQDNNCVDDFGD